MFALVLIGFVIIFSYGVGNVAAANASTIYVNGSSGQDTWDGQLAVWNGTSGPKATIKNAVGTVLSDGTVYVANGIYNESNIQINTNMTIVGESQQNTIINGQKSGQSIFTIINDKTNVTISNLTMEDGKGGDGSAICSSGNLTVTNITFTNNNASNAGGAISGDKYINVTDCNFTSNNAGNCGGAISVGEDIYVTDSVFTNNNASNAGGAISGDESIYATDCVFTNNTAGSGGAISGENSTYATDCVFTNNTASNCGGAISGDESIYATDCVFTNNTASNSGGAISGDEGLNVTDCTFTSNNVGNCGGAIESDGNLDVTYSTFVNNTARLGGAICNDGTAEINFNRIIGKTATGSDIVSDGSINADNNWWGSNEGPSTGSVEGLTVTKWLVLSVTTNSTILELGQTCNFTADLLYDNGILSDPNNPELYYHDPSNGCVPNGTPITFSGILGNINPINTSLIEGQTQGIFTPNNNGTGKVTATLDNQSVNTSIMIGPPTAIANVNGGLYNVNKVVILSMNEPGMIYYTLNGSTPTLTSATYLAPITVSSTTTLKYLAVNLAGNQSPVYIQTYTIDKIPPKVSKTTPTNKKTNVSRTSTIVIKFSENIKSSTYYKNIKVKNLTTGKYVTIHESISGNTLNIKTSKTRTKYNWYEIIIPKAAIKDNAGNNLLANYTFKFKTGK